MDDEQIIPPSSILSNVGDVEKIRPNNVEGFSADLGSKSVNVTVQLKPDTTSEDVFTKDIALSGNVKDVEVYYLSGSTTDFAAKPNKLVHFNNTSSGGLIEVKENLRAIKVVFLTSTTEDSIIKNVHMSIHACFKKQGKCKPVFQKQVSLLKVLYFV